MGDGSVFIVLGSLASKVLLVWRVESVDVPATNHQVFLLGGGRVFNDSPTALVVTDLTDFNIVPASPISPIHYLLALKRKLPARMGVVLLQHAAAVPVLLYAAQNAFFSLGLMISSMIQRVAQT